MSKVDDYRLRIEFSAIRAELSSSKELRDTWLQIRQSYEHLLMLETSATADVAQELLSLRAGA